MLYLLGVILGMAGLAAGAAALCGRRWPARRRRRAVTIERSVTVPVRPEVVYRFWRDLGNLPRVLSHLDAVEVLGTTRSRWRVRAGGTTLEWEAEIVNDLPRELIAWRTRGPAPVRHAGTVRFEPTAGGGTIVRLALQYAPRNGGPEPALAGLAGAEAARRVEADLAGLGPALTGQAGPAG